MQVPVIMGISAGVINMDKTALCSEDQDFEETTIYQGLAVDDITIEPHFNADDLDKVALLKHLSLSFPIYALHDDSAIVVKDGDIQYIGEVHYFSNGNVKKING